MTDLESAARATLHVQLFTCGSSHAARCERPEGISVSNRDEGIDECDDGECPVSLTRSSLTCTLVFFREIGPVFV